jgi:hypothetical protein
MATGSPEEVRGVTNSGQWWGTVGERLQWAIDQQPPEGKRRGVGLLISKLEAEGSPGANYPSITSYLKDQVTPPLDFVVGAARALGVNAAWLAFGDGYPTLEIEMANAPEKDNTVEQEIAAGFAAGFPGQPPPYLMGNRALRSLWIFFARSPGLASDSEAFFYDGAKKAAEAVRAPLDALGIDARELRARTADIYITQVALALQVLLSDPQVQDGLLAVGRGAADLRPEEEAEG